MAATTDHVKIALLEQRIAGLESLVGKIEARDSNRIRAGVLVLGTIITALFSAIAALGNYIWKITVGQ